MTIVGPCGPALQWEEGQSSTYTPEMAYLPSLRNANHDAAKNVLRRVGNIWHRFSGLWSIRYDGVNEPNGVTSSTRMILSSWIFPRMFFLFPGACNLTRALNIYELRNSIDGLFVTGVTEKESIVVVSSSCRWMTIVIAHPFRAVGSSSLDQAQLSSPKPIQVSNSCNLSKSTGISRERRSDLTTWWYLSRGG